MVIKPSLEDLAPGFELRLSLESNPEDTRLDVKKRFKEEQIIGLLRQVESGLPVENLCRRYGFSEASYYLWRNAIAISAPA